MPNEDELADQSPAGEDERLTRLAAICSAFPEVGREYMGLHSCFVVRKKTLAYFLNNHHGDGIVSLCVKVVPGESGELIASDPERFYPCLPWRKRLG